MKKKKTKKGKTERFDNTCMAHLGVCKNMATSNHNQPYSISFVWPQLVYCFCQRFKYPSKSTCKNKQL